MISVAGLHDRPLSHDRDAGRHRRRSDLLEPPAHDGLAHVVVGMTGQAHGYGRRQHEHPVEIDEIVATGEAKVRERVMPATAGVSAENGMKLGGGFGSVNFAKTNGRLVETTTDP